MVSVVTGSGLGVFNSSKDVLGSAGELGQSRSGRSGERLSVNAANGNLVVQRRDEYLVGAGPSIELLRTYNSLGGWDGDNGDGWRLSFYRRVWSVSGTVNTAGSTVLRTDADGHDTKFLYDAGKGLYISTEGAGQNATLRYATSGWTWTDADTGTQETYTSADAGATYRLSEVRSAEGHRIAVTYTGSQITQLATFKSGSTSADESLTLSYSGLLLSQVSASHTDAQGVAQTRSLTRYSYVGNRLDTVTTDLSPENSAITDGKTYTVKYTYDASGRLQTLTQSDGSRQSVAYDASGRVKSITDDQGHGLCTLIRSCLMPKPFSAIFQTRPVNIASLSVRMALGLPCSAMAAHRWLSRVQVHLCATTRRRRSLREPWSSKPSTVCCSTQLRSRLKARPMGTARTGAPRTHA